MGKNNKKKNNRLKKEKKNLGMMGAYSSIVNPPLGAMEDHFYASDKMRVWWGSIVEKALMKTPGSFLSNLVLSAYLCKLIELAVEVPGVPQAEEGSWAAFIIAFAAAFLAALIIFLYHSRDFIRGFFDCPGDDALRERVSTLEAEVESANEGRDSAVEERDSAVEELAQVVASQGGSLNSETWNSVVELSGSAAPVLQAVIAGLHILAIINGLFFRKGLGDTLDKTPQESTSEVIKVEETAPFETPHEETLRVIKMEEITPFETLTDNYDTPQKTTFESVISKLSTFAAAGTCVDADDLGGGGKDDSFSSVKSESTPPTLRVETEFLETPDMDLCRPKTPATKQ
jgi:hypothetical protein